MFLKMPQAVDSLKESELLTATYWASATYMRVKSNVISEP